MNYYCLIFMFIICTAICYSLLFETSDLTYTIFIHPSTHRQISPVLSSYRVRRRMIFPKLKVKGLISRLRMTKISPHNLMLKTMRMLYFNKLVHHVMFHALSALVGLHCSVSCWNERTERTNRTTITTA